MPVYITAQKDEHHAPEQEHDAQPTALWINNLNFLHATAATLQAGFATVDNPAAAQEALRQQLSGKSGTIESKIRKIADNVLGLTVTRKVVLTGWSAIVQGKTTPAIFEVTQKPALIKFHLFMDLPPKIRDKVYDYVMKGELYGPGVYKLKPHNTVHARVYEDPVELRAVLRNRTSNDILEPTFLPAVCRLSRETRFEATNRFIANSTFFVCSIYDNQYLQTWLNRVKDGFKSVRSLHFDFFDCFPTGSPDNADLELAARCPGLTDIKIAFHTKELEVYRDTPDGYGQLIPRSTETMWSYYKLDRLKNCHSLKWVLIKRKGHHSLTAMTATQNLAAMIEQQMALAGRSVTAEIVWA